jgi:hypothetical protein
MRKAAAILLTVIVFTPVTHAAQLDKPWRIEVPRQTMLKAWERLKKLEIPGVATDSRFQITGESRYVSPGGDDANPGTQDKPWRTLQKACAELKPDTVVYLMAGTYYGPAARAIESAATRSRTSAIAASRRWTTIRETILADYNCIAAEATVATASPAYTYGPHNIRADPGFAGEATLDFTIRPDSPCVDAGDPKAGAYHGKAPDIGLFETGHP